MTFFTRAKQYPPLLVRLMARRDHKPMSNMDVVEWSGLPLDMVWDISTKMSWDGVDLETLRKFTVACNMDFTSSKQMRRADDYLRKQPVTWQYLRKSPHWKNQFEPLTIILLRWGESRNKSNG